MEDTRYIHVCNYGTEELILDNHEISVCTSFDELSSEISKYSSYQYILLINIHLIWDNKILSENYGFDVANIIRTQYKSRAPIIFYSPIQKDFFELKSKEELKYKIIFGSGSTYLEAGFSQKDLFKVGADLKPVSKACLHDLVTMLCNLKGYVIDVLNHNLKIDSDIRYELGIVKRFLSKAQIVTIKLDFYLEELEQHISQNDIIKFNTTKAEFINGCKLYLTDGGGVHIEKVEEKPRFTILVLDDVAAELNNVSKWLGQDFNVITTSRAEKAIEQIRQDEKNEILTVISDWRLYNNEDENYWQSIQGYDVLDYTASRGVRALFALTSQAEFVVHQIRNQLGIRFTLYKKENVRTEGQWKLFSDVIRKGCIEALEARADLLDNCKFWNKSIKKQPSLKRQYVSFWNSTSMQTNMNKIIASADSFYQQYRSGVKCLNLGNTFSMSDKTAHKIEQTLVLRLLWLAVWYNNKGHQPLPQLAKTVYKYLFGEPGDGSVAQKMRWLCLKQNDIRMFPEEKFWLKKNSILI